MGLLPVFASLLLPILAELPAQDELISGNPLQ